MRVRVLAVAGLACLPLAHPMAQCETFATKASDGVYGSAFGLRVALSATGNTAVVTDFRHGQLTGAAYVFERNWKGWIETAILIPSDGAPSENFGAYGVSATDDVVVVGSPSHKWPSGPKGAAYVFERTATGWQESAILRPANPQPLNLFGYSVSVDADRIAVGDPHSHALGSAFVFERIGGTWIETAVLAHATLSPSDPWMFGYGVSVWGDELLIGAPDMSTFALGHDEAGAAYLFRKGASGWSRTAEFAGTSPGGHFGRAVALHGDHALVGASDDGGDEYWSVGVGSVHFFDRVGDQWSKSASYAAPADPSPMSQFGAEYRLSLTEDWAIVGRSANKGSAYVFHRDAPTWTFSKKITATPLSLGDTFGASVAMGPGVAVVGDASGVGVPGLGGAVHFFAMPSSGWPSLWSAPNQLSLSIGGTQQLSLEACDAYAGHAYLLLGSMTGTAPPTSVDGHLLPLVVDAYTLYTLANPNQPPLHMSAGVLDSLGSASASIAVPSGLSPGLAGLKIHHAFVAFSTAGTAAVAFASTPASLEFGP